MTIPTWSDHPYNGVIGNWQTLIDGIDIRVRPQD